MFEEYPDKIRIEFPKKKFKELRTKFRGEIQENPREESLGVYRRKLQKEPCRTNGNNPDKNPKAIPKGISVKISGISLEKSPHQPTEGKPEWATGEIPRGAIGRIPEKSEKQPFMESRW